MNTSIYELLPALYVLSGFMAGHVIDNNLAFGSGILLTITGLHVFYLRLKFRAQWSV